jgi:hypothetical protein
LSKGAFALGLWSIIVLVAIAAQSVEPKEILQLLGKMTIAIGVFAGRH